jgi:hypothetical protein
VQCAVLRLASISLTLPSPGHRAHTSALAAAPRSPSEEDQGLLLAEWLVMGGSLAQTRARLDNYRTSPRRLLLDDSNSVVPKSEFTPFAFHGPSSILNLQTSLSLRRNCSVTARCSIHCGPRKLDSVRHFQAQQFWSLRLRQRQRQPCAESLPCRARVAWSKSRAGGTRTSSLGPLPRQAKRQNRERGQKNMSNPSSLLAIASRLPPSPTRSCCVIC